ncbi:unnamed protein product [Rotaria sp. Silwood2]|nr:unnamed protein product [Rotaria sp. Silwood2]CAF4477298.1 unnamed protein product [Rotaria sp. Silwood2]CAF4499612.1 unnamed protein product [Rotaria sp. Silwood2]
MASEDIMIMDETSSSSSSTSTSNESSSTSSNSVKPSITETKSNKRKVMLVIDGFNYQFKNFNKDKSIKFWRCAKRNCRVLLHTTIQNEFLRYSGKITRHSHLPNPAEAEVRNLREAMRKRAEEEILPAQQIAEQEVRQALLTGEALAVLPNIINLGHNLVQNRRKMTPPLPQSSSFFIPESYTKDYHNNTRLLLHDSDDSKFQIDSSGNLRSEGRVLIWSSDIQLNLLFDSQRLHMDGTFSSSPPNFDQVFIIQAIVHGTCVPVVYALLPDRKAKTYIHLFTILFDEAKRLNKKLNPLLIMTDFEPGLAKAISLEFSEKTIQKGCFFHFCQSVYRNVQSHGLSSTYLDNIMIRSVIRQMMALALVPEQYIPSLFDNLGKDLNDSERDDLLPIFEYFKNYWMRQISMWNVADIPDKTNNFSEGYNNRFKRRLEKTHPNIWHFIDSIRKEVNTIHDIITQINVGMGPRTKRLKSRITEQRTKELYDRFNNNQITVQELLHGLSFFVAKE